MAYAGGDAVDSLKNWLEEEEKQRKGAPGIAGSVLVTIGMTQKAQGGCCSRKGRICGK